MDINRLKKIVLNDTHHRKIQYMSPIYSWVKMIPCHIKVQYISIGNKEEIIPEFSLEITQFDFTKGGGGDEAWTKSLS